VSGLTSSTTWVVTGANRGIGLELCRQAHARGEDVVAACRRSSPELDAVGCTVAEDVDVTRADVGAALDHALGDRPVDVLVCNAGVLRREQIDVPDLEGVRLQFDVNTLGPLRVVSALLPRLAAGSKIGLVSSKAGSIGDGPSGGMYGYRMSKAALNMLGANLAHDLAPRGIAVVVLHPGFVRTEMTGGAGGVDPDQAAAGLIARIDELELSTTGRFVHANGDEVPW
jgi:NAD(P)-dependent dehydrogenase (short-subunit alcohol dehydrogenase family)